MKTRTRSNFGSNELSNDDLFGSKISPLEHKQRRKAFGVPYLHLNVELEEHAIFSWEAPHWSAAFFLHLYTMARCRDQRSHHPG